MSVYFSGLGKFGLGGRPMALAYIDENTHRSPEISALLEIKSLAKAFGASFVIDNLSLKIRSSEIIGIVGKTGAGKSVLAGLLCGELLPTSGEISLKGRKLKSPFTKLRGAGGIARVLPTGSLLTEITVLDNLLLLGTTLHKPIFPRRGNLADAREARNLLDFVGLGEFVDYEVDALHVSQKIRLAIAIALVSEPSLLVIDNLDIDSHETYFDIASLLTRVTENRTSILLTTERFYPLADICDRMVILQDGKIVAKGMPSAPLTIQ